MAKAPVVFTFIPEDDVEDLLDENLNTNLLFFLVEGVEDIDPAYLYSEEYSDRISENEDQFGVHDSSAREPIMEGFTTYEVERDQFLACMEGIRQIYIDDGYQCSEIMQHLDISDEEADKIIEDSVTEEDRKVIKEKFWSR